MTIRSCFLVLTILGMTTAATARAQQNGSAAPDITGSWERARDASIPPQSQPPLKGQYQKEYQAKLQVLREANQKGEPIADHVVMCLPDGMPGMMSGPFPMEILQSKGQVTVIQEAYTQVRRILLDRQQKA